MHIERSGYVAIVGRPNVGKSTLLNAIVQAKVSITSKKPQTTRHRILGVAESGNVQFAFFDTPGFQKKQGGALNHLLNRTVAQTVKDADVIVFVIDSMGWSAKDDLVLQQMPADKPIILAMNKMDEHDRGHLMQLAQLASQKFKFTEIIPISAEKRTSLPILLEQLGRMLPLGERLFDADQLSDRNEKFLAAELIREKLFRLTGEELPYTSTVVIDAFTEEGRLRRIHASILVQRDSHKAMILGAKGAKIKQIASEARVDMERLFDAPVFLELFIKVKSGWADSDASLRSYGYE
jgi:GTPase